LPNASASSSSIIGWNSTAARSRRSRQTEIRTRRV
jgi:hypothetical protein